MSDSSIELIKQIDQIKKGGGKAEPKPHKLVLLLSVVEAIDEGALQENKITLNDEITSRFSRNFTKFALDGDWKQPTMPFFHLRTAPFWRHKVCAGMEAEYAKTQRVGGGSSLLNSIVDYAYFTDDAFEVLTNPQKRSVVKTFLVEALKFDAVKKMSVREIRRIGLAFHEGFPLVRSAVAEVLSVAARKGAEAKLNFDLLREETSLGRNYAKAMPRYCQGAGLLNHKNELTSFGSRVVQSDRYLEQPETMWLCHYHLAASDGPGPEFWHTLVSDYVIAGDELKTTQLGEVLKKISEDNGSAIADRTAQTAASVFLGTYSREDCFGRLGILEAREAGSYLVKEVEPPSPLVFGFAVDDYWRRHLPDQTSVWIDEFNKSGGPAQTLLMGQGQINHAMRELSRMGIASVQLTQPPYQFSPLWRDQGDLLDRIYGA
jgi:hypothetical protein